MATNTEEMQKLGKDNVEAAIKGNAEAATESFDVMSKGFQAIAAEVINYSKRSWEDQAAAMQKIMGARSPEKALEIQSHYVRAATEDFMAQATKINQLSSDLIKEMYNPIGAAICRNVGST